jgi:hypothetical protein
MADVASDVTIGMLGPLEVRVGFGEPVEVVGPRLRTLVIGLALDPDRVVLASQLIDAVWHEDRRAVIGGWERGDLPGLQLGGLTAEEALALERPAMTYVREQLRERPARQLRRAWRRWLHPTSGRRSGVRFL